jgi:SAM-dependent methyltransferase
LPVSIGDPERQGVVDSFFDRHASYWQDVYRADEVQGLVYRRRMETVLEWVDALNLPASASVLEVGCGAGLLSLELADRGLDVIATDSSPEMVELVGRLARERSTNNLDVRRADAHSLPFEAGQFRLVVALGLLPWVHDPGRAVREMARVLAPRGCLIVTADNRARLNFILEPRENPLLTPVRLARRTLRRRLGEPDGGPPSYRHLPSEIDRMLESADVSPVRRTTIGFGPFTFLGHRLLPDRWGTVLHGRLENVSADQSTLRRLGWHYIVAGHKAGEPSERDALKLALQES